MNQTMAQIFTDGAVEYLEYDFEERKRRLQSRPMNRAVARENLLYLKSVFDRHNIKFWLMFGTCLGAVREGDFIEHDSDTDIGVFLQDQSRIVTVVRELAGQGLEPIRTLPPDTILSLMRKDEYIDLYFYTRETDEFGIPYWTFLREFDRLYGDHFDQFESVPFIGSEFRVPGSAEKLLELQYGRDWRVPIKDTANAVCSSIKDYHRLRGDGFSNRIDLPALFGDLTDYVILERAEKFPNYMECDSIPVLCKNRADFAKHLEASFAALKDADLKLHATRKETEWHLDFFPTGAVHPDLRIRIREDFTAFRTINIDPGFVQLLLENEMVMKAGTAIRILTDSQDLAYRMFETVEHIDSDPVRAEEHRQHIYDHININGDTTFLKLVNDFSNLKVSVKELNGKHELEVEKKPVAKPDSLKGDDPSIAGLLRPNILQMISTSQCRIQQFEPKNLLTPERFDVTAKLIYARHRHHKIKSDWAQRLYAAHLNVFNGCREPDGTGKNSFNDFLTAFNRTLESIQAQGFDAKRSLVPVGNDNVLLDGAHRVAAAMLYGKSVAAVCCDRPAFIYDYEFFRNYTRHVRTGLIAKWTDPMAVEYCRLKQNTYIVSLFPAAEGQDETVKRILQDCGRIVYTKQVVLQNYGPTLLMRQMYSREPWLGDSLNRFAGAAQKADLCFSRSGSVRVYLLESDDPAAVTAAKEKIRKVYNIGNHSVHINDSHAETLKLARIFFNENSLHFLNNARKDYYEKFHQLFRQYRQWIRTQSADPSDFCIDGSGVLAAYGLRQARDLDFLHFGEETHVTGNPLIESHNHEAEYHVTHRDDIIFNPENHFYYQGVKFASLEIIRAMKVKRGEVKDLDDVAKIDELCKQAGGKSSGPAGSAVRPRLINIVYAHSKANGFSMHKGHTTIVWSTVPIEKCNLYAFQDAFSFTGRQPGINVLLMQEPVVVLPGQYDGQVFEYFDHVLTSLDSLAEKSPKIKKFRHPVFDGPFDQKTLKSINTGCRVPFEDKENAVCMISGNKVSNVPGELYSKRVEIAAWFHANGGMRFDVYGRPPFSQLPNYLGELNPYDKKFATLARYRYSLCFENVYDPFWSKGYLTEKLPHCLMCGTVPIYLGCANIEKYVPRECFIDYRRFQDPRELAAFLEGLSDTDYRTYLDNIDAWVRAGNLESFSIHHTYDQLALLASPELKPAEVISGAWQTGPAPEFDGSQLNVVAAPPHWSWTDLASKAPSQELLSGNFTLTDNTMPKVSSGGGVKDPVSGAAMLPFMHLKSRDWSLKRETLALFKQLFNIQVFVETGTYQGNTTAKAAEIFPLVHTIELSPDYYQAAAERFRGIETVKVHRGDSVEVFKKILSGIKGQVLFWLDAHFSGDATARGAQNTAVLGELEAIKAAGITDGVILIDDIRYFQAVKRGLNADAVTHGYPDLGQVRAAILKINSAYNFYLLGDAVISYLPNNGVEVSPVVQACTESRLFDNAESVSGTLFESERIIARARGAEMDTLALLARSFPSEEQEVGHHYLLWLGLMLLEQGEYRLACKVLASASRCGCRHWRLGWYLSLAANSLGGEENFPDEIRDAARQVPYCLPAVSVGDQSVSAETPFQKDGTSRPRPTALIFSKDRALQLDGTLRSFLACCTDPESIDLKVLYTTSDVIHDRQYQTLIAEYRGVEFIRENDFKAQVLRITTACRYLLFLVDDNIFVKDFSIQKALQALDETPEAIGFSLRLGRNVTHRLYPEKQSWKVPALRTRSGGILQFDWTDGDADMGFGYPLEVSSSLYRSRDLYLLLNRIDFSNPNTLELILDSSKAVCRGLLNDLLCFEKSVTFCNPVNLVQTAWTNYAGREAENSSSALAERFADGYRLDPAAYAGFVPHAYHQEVAMTFFRPFDEVQVVPEGEPAAELVSIIILNYNGKKHIRRCLESIRNCATEPYELIVVDNASTDNSLAYLRTLKEITLVENPENLGCPPARTQAMALARGKYVMLLDNDTIVTPGWLTTFFGHARRNPSIGLFGPCSNHVSGPQKVDEVSYEDVQGLESFAGTFSDQNRGRLTIVPRLVGFCMFISREVIDRIGAPDPRFGKFGFEDDDYTWRAIIAGFQAAIAQDVFIHHTGGPQMKGNAQYNQYVREAWDIFKAKWDLPATLEYGTPFDVADYLAQPFDREKHFIPVPDKSSIKGLITTPDDGFTAGLPSGLQQDLEQRLVAGEQEFAEGNSRAAEEIFTGILADSPGQAQAHNNLGVLYCAAGDKTKALQHYEEAVRLLPETVIFQKNLADFQYIEQGNVGLATRTYLRLLEQYPKDLELLLALGRISTELGQIEAAMVYFGRLLQVDSSLAAAEMVIESAKSAVPGKTPARTGTIYCIGDSHVSFFSGRDKIAPSPPIPSEDVLPFFKTFRLGPVLAYNLVETGTTTGGREALFKVLKTLPENSFVLLCFGEIDCRAHLLKQSRERNISPETAADACVHRYFDVIREIRDMGYRPIIWSVVPATARKDLDAAVFPTFGTYHERNSVTRIFNQKAETLAQESGIPFVSLFEELLDHDGLPDAVYFMDGLHLAQKAMPLAIRKLLPIVETLQLAPAQRSEKAGDTVGRSLQPGVNDKVSILVQVSEQPVHLHQCVQSLVTHSPEPLEILLLSTFLQDENEALLEAVLKEYDLCRLVRCEKAQALNEGVKAAAGDRIVVLYDDVRVAEGWYNALNRALISDPRTGVIGVMASSAPGIQNDRSGVYDSMEQFDDYARQYLKKNRYRRVPVRTLADICILFRRSLYERVGNFDAALEKPVLMTEDFCIHAGVEGFQNMIAADVVVHHFKDAASNRDFAGGNRRKLDAKWRNPDRKTPAGRKVHIRNLMDKADKMSRAGEVDTAVTDLIQGIGLYPDARQLYQKLARVLINAGRYQDALEALEILPDDQDTPTGELVLRGTCLEGLDRLEEAAAHVEQVLNNNPESASAWNLKGILAYRQGDNLAAAVDFTRASEIDPGYGEPCTNQGLLRLAAGEAENGLALLTRGFVLEPTVAPIVETFYTAMVDCHTLEQAENIFRDSLALYPGTRDLMHRLVDLLLHQGKFEPALEIIGEMLVRFGVEADLLDAALDIRAKFGPLAIKDVPADQPTLSLCMIVKNEEKSLAACLNSVKPVVDEMIVVDTGSTDKTKDIANVFGAKVYDFEWNDDFSEARNFSLSKANGDWIFVLDADEVISPNDYEDLEDALKCGTSVPVAYSITTRNYVQPMNVPEWVANDGKYREEEAGTGWYPSPKIRLFTNDPRMRFEGRVHELVEPSLKKTGISPTPCPVPVHHYGKLLDAGNISKGEEYYFLGKKKIEAGDGDIDSIIELAKQAAELKRHNEAIELWERVLECKSDMPLVYLNLSNAYIALGEYKAGLEASKKALNLDPGLKEAALNYSTCALCAGDIKTAVLLLEGLLQQAPDHPVGMALLSAGYCLDGDKEKAFEMMGRIKQMGFECGNYLVDLAERLLSSKRIESAVLLLECAVESENADNAVFSLLEKCRNENIVY